VREIAPLARGLVVREVLGRPPRDVVLMLAPKDDATGPPAWRILVSGDGDAPRIHILRGRFERHDGPLGPFFRRVIDELAGKEVRAITQVAGDRIVAIEVRGADARSGGDETRTLIAELVGRHSNLVLLGPADRVLCVLVPPPAGKADPRLVVGSVYVPPPGRAPKPASDGAPVLAQMLSAVDAPLTLRKHETSNAAPLSWLVENALGAQASDAFAARTQKHLEERLQRKQKNARSLVFGLEQRLEASAQFERVQQDGELVKANLARIPRGATSITVEDFFTEDAAPRKIALDAKLSPNENLSRLFERAKKLERARFVVAEELALARAKLAAYDALLAAIGAEGADLEAIEQRAIDDGWLEPLQHASAAEQAQHKKDPPARIPYKVFHGIAGGEIRVGRSAKDNDDLTFHHAHGNDLWLHTADTPGSHVVLKLAKGADPHPEELLDAAHLAVHFSPMKDATKARVHYARRKEVHKPRGAKPGLVTLSGGKILDVRMQPERLQRLLGSHRA